MVAAKAVVLALSASLVSASGPADELAHAQIRARAAEAARDLAARATGCDDVHLFLARGNNEPYPGRQRNIVNGVCGQLDNCGYEDIYFTAGEEQVYCDTVHQGTLNGQAQIINYAVRCPDSLLVVTGYSQGAHIVGDILGGDGDTMIFNCGLWNNAALSATSDVGKRIKAVTIFGDVRHTAGQSYNVLDGADSDGLIPRDGTYLSDLNEWSDRLRAYCAAGDPICAGGDTVADHLNYFDLYSDDASDWIISMLGVSTVATATAWAIPTSISGKVEPYSGTSYTTTDHPSPSVTPDLNAVITASAATTSSPAKTSSSSSEPQSSSSVASSSSSLPSSSSISTASAESSVTDASTTTPPASSTAAANTPSSSTTSENAAGRLGLEMTAVCIGLAILLSGNTL